MKNIHKCDTRDFKLKYSQSWDSETWSKFCDLKGKKFTNVRLVNQVKNIHNRKAFDLKWKWFEVKNIHSRENCDLKLKLFILMIIVICIKKFSQTWDSWFSIKIFYNREILDLKWKIFTIMRLVIWSENSQMRDDLNWKFTNSWISWFELTNLQILE